MREQTKYQIAVALAGIIGFAGVTHQSFWIDEGAAALKAMTPTLLDWWRALRTEANSNLQLVFQLFYEWAWEKIFGHSEFALRCSNIPWFALGMTAMMSIFPRRSSLQFAVLVLALTNAFLWYYLSEARPYIVLFAFSALTATCLIRLHNDPEESMESFLWFRFFCLGIVGLCATSLIAVPWAMAAIAATTMWIGLTKTRHTLLRFCYTTAATVLVLAILGAYFLWTARIGARASDVARTDLKSTLFSFYELFGLAGLGPGRLDIREHGFKSFAPFLFPLAIGLGSISVISSAAVLNLRKKIQPRATLFFLIAVAAPLCATFVAAHAAHMRLLARHLTPVLPFLLAFLATGLARLLASRTRSIRLVAWASTIILFASSLEIRLADRHRRDDYRSAASVALRAIADGKAIWWAADVSTAAYYNVPLNSPNLTLSQNLDDHSFEAPPDIICLSKPDIYDPAGKIDMYIRENHFTMKRKLPAFQIFERPPAHR